MSMGLEIVEKLEALGLGKYSAEPRTLFLEGMPDDPDEVGAVFETGGSPPELGFGVPGIQFENPTVAIWFRGKPEDSEAPHAKARTAYLELPKVQAQALSGAKYLTLVPMQPPFRLERDDSRRRDIWIVNLLAQKEPS